MKQLIYVSLLLLLVSACNNTSEETKSLQKILATYNEKIKPDHHIYIIRSQHYCSGCVQRIYLDMEKILKKDKQVTIISYDKNHLTQSTLKKVNFILDSKNVTDKILNNYANMTIFETKRGEVLNYHLVEGTENIELPEFMKQALIK